MEPFYEDYTHCQRDVIISDTEHNDNYAALQSDYDAAYLSATRAEHAADANIPEARVDRCGYLQLINGYEAETVSTSHTICTQLDRLDVVQRPLSDNEISPYDTTVVGRKVSGSTFIDNTLITSCVSASALDNSIPEAAIVNDEDNVASAVYRSDDDNVANSVLYNGNTINEYDEINDVDVDTYEEIATAEDGVGVYNEISAEDSEYAEVDTRRDGVHNEGANIYNELQQSYAVTTTLSSRLNTGISRLLSLTVKQGIIVIIVAVLIMLAVAAVLIVAKGYARLENTNNMKVIANPRKLKMLSPSDVTMRDLFQGYDSCIYFISSTIFEGRLMAAYDPNVTLLHILTVRDSKATVEKKVSLPARVNDAVWTTDGHIVCTIAFQSVLRLTLDGDIVTIKSMSEPTTLYADVDGVIYLTDSVEGIYRSTDNGITWISLLNTTMNEEWGILQAIKVFSDSKLNTYDLWTVERQYETLNETKYEHNHSLRVYTVDKNSHTVQSWRNITLPNNISLNSLSFVPHLACDDKYNVFLAVYDTGLIHLLSAKEGHYDHLLVNLTQFELDDSNCLSVDTKRNVMHVGQCNGKIASLTLTYED